MDVAFRDYADAQFQVVKSETVLLKGGLDSMTASGQTQSRRGRDRHVRFTPDRYTSTPTLRTVKGSVTSPDRLHHLD